MVVSIGGHHHSSVQPKQRAHDLRLGPGAVCAGVNYCGNPGCDLVLVVRGYQIRCADIGWVTGRNVLYFWLAEELM